MASLSAEELLEEIDNSSLSQVLNGVLFDVRGKMSLALGATEILRHDLNNDKVILDNIKFAPEILLKSLTDMQEMLVVLAEANRRLMARNSSNRGNDSGN